LKPLPAHITTVSGSIEFRLKEKGSLFIAEVVAAKAEQGDPLLYHDRDYFRLGERCE